MSCKRCPKTKIIIRKESLYRFVIKSHFFAINVTEMKMLNFITDTKYFFKCDVDAQHHRIWFKPELSFATDLFKAEI